VRSGALNTAHWATNLHRPVMGVPGPVSSAASTGVNQLIRLGQASMVINAQDVITDVTTRAARAAGGAKQLDESFVPGPVRSTQRAIPTPAAGASAPRR
jgi:DNA processing protein